MTVESARVGFGEPAAGEEQVRGEVVPRAVARLRAELLQGLADEVAELLVGLLAPPAPDEPPLTRQPAQAGELEEGRGHQPAGEVAGGAVHDEDRGLVGSGAGLRCLRCRGHPGTVGLR